MSCPWASCFLLVTSLHGSIVLVCSSRQYAFVCSSRRMRSVNIHSFGPREDALFNLFLLVRRWLTACCLFGEFTLSPCKCNLPFFRLIIHHNIISVLEFTPNSIRLLIRSVLLEDGPFHDFVFDNAHLLRWKFLCTSFGFGLDGHRRGRAIHRFCRPHWCCRWCTNQIKFHRRR